MHKGRLEAFSDGVIAIIITIMVLELKVPLGANFKSLQPLIPKFISYLVSFVYIGIYWNNHHHMLHTVKKVNGGILWANMHLLFWLSLIPFTTAWMGENYEEIFPTTLYGVNLLLAGLAYYLLQINILKKQGSNSILAKAIGKDLKGKMSPILYTSGIISSFFNIWLAQGIFILVVFIWFIPDKRIEKVLDDDLDNGKN